MIKGVVLGSEIDQNGNIKVKTEYTLTDGSKSIGHTRYNFRNFSRENVQGDIDTHCETLMKKVWILKRHQELISSIKVDDLTKDLTSCEIVIKPAEYDEQGNEITPAETLIIDDK